MRKMFGLMLTDEEFKALRMHLLRQRATSNSCDGSELTAVWNKVMDEQDRRDRADGVRRRFSCLGEVTLDDLMYGANP
jgi:hypothetical protein